MSSNKGRRTCEICGIKEAHLENKLFFASFPLDVQRCREWVRITGNSDLVSLPIEKLHYIKHICGNHFKKKDFNKKGNKLKKRALPCLNLISTPLSDHQISEFPLHVQSDRGNPGRCTSTPRLDTKASGIGDLNIVSLNSVDTELNSAVSHDVHIESDLAVPQIVETESVSEVPDTTGPFTWQKHSEVIVSDDEDDELRQRSEIVTDNVLYENNKNVTKRTSEFNVTREDELELQCDGNEEDDQLHRQHYKCNMCSSLINGFRYRCVQCADYDLCAACETRGAHERHYMLRIPGPRPYAEIERVLNRIRRELLDNNTVLFQDTDMLDSLKQEVKDEIEDPLHENQTTEVAEHTVAADNLNEVHDDDPLKSDTDMQSTAEEEDRRQENDNIAHLNDNMTHTNDVILQDGKEDNNTRISKNVLTEPNLKVIVISSLKRKINESPTKLANMNISNIQKSVDSKKIRIFPASAQKLANNVSNIKLHLHSNKIRLLPASVKQLPDNIGSIQQHLATNKMSFLPDSTKQLPDNISSIQQHVATNKTRFLSASTKQLPDNINSIQQHLATNKRSFLSASTEQLPDNISSIQQHLATNKTSFLPDFTKQLPDNISSIQQHLATNKRSFLSASTEQLPDNISSIQQHLATNKTSFLPDSTKQLPDNISSIQ